MNAARRGRVRLSFSERKLLWQKERLRFANPHYVVTTTSSLADSASPPVLKLNTLPPASVRGVRLETRLRLPPGGPILAPKQRAFRADPGRTTWRKNQFPGAAF